MHTYYLENSRYYLFLSVFITKNICIPLQGILLLSEHPEVSFVLSTGLDCQEPQWSKHEQVNQKKLDKKNHIIRNKQHVLI